MSRLGPEDKSASISDVLDALGKAGQPAARPRTCGGALVPVTRDSWKHWERTFDVDFAPMPEIGDGSFNARVVCSAEVVTKMGVGGFVHGALCARCAGIERRVAKILAEVAAQTEQPR